MAFERAELVCRVLGQTEMELIGVEIEEASLEWKFRGKTEASVDKKIEETKLLVQTEAKSVGVKIEEATLVSIRLAQTGDDNCEES